MMSSSSHIRRIIEKDGQTLVSFDDHSAYFIAGPDVADALRQAQAAELIVHFTYDKDLNILGVVAHGA